MRFLPRALKAPLRRLLLREIVVADEPIDGEIAGHVTVLAPARLRIADPAREPFLGVAKHYPDGWFERGRIFVAELPGAAVHPRTGLVCTRRFRAIADKGLEHRMGNYEELNHLRPLALRRRAGAHSTPFTCLSGNFWHWMVDCLPKVLTLSRAFPGRPITLLMPAGANEFQRETLAAILPEAMRVEWVAGDGWIRTETFLWASLASGLAMGALPRDYLDEIRRGVFRRYGLPEVHAPSERIYVSRRRARWRKVLNEDALMAVLARYGFRLVELETLSFREQVELFHRAEIVAGPHGAGLGTLFFSGEIPVLALYSNRTPPNYFHSLSVALGQRHHFVCHDAPGEDDGFEADLGAVERVLADEMGLRPSGIARSR